MATPRKHWFRVADSILREGWTDRSLATFVRLLAHLNQRWARDGLEPGEACNLWLSPQDCMSIAGLSTPRRGRDAVRRLPAECQLTAMRVTDERRGVASGVRLIWPKYAEFQGLTAPKLPESRPRASLSAPAPAPAPARREEPRAVARRSRAPDALEPEQQEALKAWCSSKHPDHLATLPALVEACLDHHRAKGTTHADWVATCRTWVRRQQDFVPSRGSPVRVGRDDGLRAILHPRTASGLPSKLEEWEQEARNGTLRRIDPSAAIAQLAARVRPPDN